jgi:hypothetical protein
MYGWRWRRRESDSIDLGFVVNKLCEGGGMQPSRRDDVGSTLLLQQKSKPQWQIGSIGWSKLRCGALEDFSTSLDDAS